MNTNKTTSFVFVDLGLSVKWATCNVGASRPWDNGKLMTIKEANEGGWKVPTKEQWDELTNDCTWSWTNENGTKGYKITSKANGNSIFLPAAGFFNKGHFEIRGYFGSYWSSSLSTDYPGSVWSIYFNSSEVGLDDYGPYFGLSVRPVSE